MSWLYRTLIRPTLFTQDSEDIHNQTITALGWISRHKLLCDALASFFEPPELPVSLWNLTFPNPVGLAAGMDKTGEALPAWAAFGFGFTELGAVTWHPQPGNDRPRVFRAIPDQALINRMGFNNPGAEAIASVLGQWRAMDHWPKHPVGINLGKSKITPLDKAPDDYASSLRVLWPHADFFVVNVSSPNTPNLRQLQDKQALEDILAAMQETNLKQSASPELSHKRAANVSSTKPVLVKVAPDLSFEALDEILELAATSSLAGIVATNTSITRPESSDEKLRRVYSEAGGLSGKPLRNRSTEVVRHIHRQTKGSLPIIGVGGIFNADDAWEKIAAGASLVQIYTGMVYEGPDIARNIVEGLIERLEQNALQTVHEAAGSSTDALDLSRGSNIRFPDACEPRKNR
jgi:dihydroorotate dehydrogenase